jgi:hypothetical protein
MRPVLALILCFVAWVAVAQEKRIALIIGNNEYRSNAVLKNPVNDARAMDETLQRLGFHTLRYENLGLNELKKAIDAFGKQLFAYDVGLFYYAGHGIQYKGRNYLVPVDVDLSIPQQVEFDCVPAERVLVFMEHSGTLVNLLILDACRNNPFERGWNRSIMGNGLAFMNAPSGSLIAYATSPGSVASDGAFENGLYTGALLRHMATPNITVEQVFKRVRAEIETITNNQQTPWESTSLKGDFYFNRDSSVATTSAIQVSNAGGSRDLALRRRHALRVQAEVPFLFGFGYEFFISEKVAISAQTGWMNHANSLMMVNMMGSMGSDKLELMVKRAYQSGTLHEGGINYHFGNNYVGIFGQSVTMNGAVATAIVESNFNTDIGLMPVKPGRTDTEPQVIDITSRLTQVGMLYGRILPLKNTNWQVRLEFAVSKNFGSSTRLYSPDRDLSSFAKDVDSQFDSWFSKYAYVPGLTVGLTRTLGKVVR